jgi:hypothetical protein
VATEIVVAPVHEQVLQDVEIRIEVVLLRADAEHLLHVPRPLAHVHAEDLGRPGGGR